jgi:hypothetical protein
MIINSLLVREAKHFQHCTLLYIQEIKCQRNCYSKLDWISLLNFCGHLSSCPFLYGHSPPPYPSPLLHITSATSRETSRRKPTDGLTKYVRAPSPDT